MTLQIKDFKSGDRVRYTHRYSQYLGTVTLVSRYLVIDNHWNIEPSSVREIVEVADGERKIGVHKAN